MNSADVFLSEQVFGPRRRILDGANRSTATGIIESLIVYTWPKNIRDSDRLKVLAALMVCGRGEDESPSKWATFVFSYAVLCFPEFTAKINAVASREYKFERLPDSFVTQAISYIDAAVEADDDDDKTLNSARAALVFPPRLPTVILTEDDDEVASCQIVPAVYGYFGLLVYLCGKKIVEKNVSAITTARPNNLIAAFSIPEEAHYCLIGDGKMSSRAHEMINQAWVTYAGARRGIITEVSLFATGSSLPQRVVYVISKMIENSGMGSAYFIHKFLLAMPHAATYSCLMPSVSAFVTSVRELAAAPTHVQPYYKLIHGDSTRVFHRNTIMALSAVAITYERYTSQSMSNFTLGEGATSAINMFDAEAVRLGHATLQSLDSAAVAATVE